MSSKVPIQCPKCASFNITRMPYPLEDKGFRCMICGKDIWLQLIDMSNVARRYTSYG